MNKKKVIVAIAIAIAVIVSVLIIIYFGNSMYEWMLRVHHLR